MSVGVLGSGAPPYRNPSSRPMSWAYVREWCAGAIMSAWWLSILALVFLVTWPLLFGIWLAEPVMPKPYKPDEFARWKAQGYSDTGG